MYKYNQQLILSRGLEKKKKNDQADVNRLATELASKFQIQHHVHNGYGI